MRILSMQATFGKLENQTIAFEPGMNVIHAPNEWGKSTWCAFIAAMLYGIDTRERTTQTALAEKERYAPWSGKPMAGRMDLEWNGKAITIERSTKGRSIFGVFSAYETQSGLPVEELTADNCGVMLLGVEKSVFLKSAFIRQNDMPVVQDEALRRRLNALVTTGDESGESDRLAQSLKDLKNQCRHNKTGLLPQAETKKAAVAAKLEQLRALQMQTQQITARMEATEREIRALENHQVALHYQAAQADLQQVEKAKNAHSEAIAQAKALETACAALPASAEAINALEQLSQLQEQINLLQRQQPPTLPEPPKHVPPFQGLDARQAQEMVSRDQAQYGSLKTKKQLTPYLLIALLGLIFTVGMAVILPNWVALCWIPAVLCAIPFILKGIPHLSDEKLMAELTGKYGAADPGQWQAAASAHAEAQAHYAAALAQYNTQRESMQAQRDQLEQQILVITQGAPVTASRKYWEQVQQQHAALAEAKKAATQAETHANALQSMLRTAEPPKEPDTLQLSQQETAQKLAMAGAQRHQLQQLLGQTQGQAETLGSEAQLEKELDDLNQRIEQLENTYHALALAQQTLEEAALELQRRFAPKIAKRAAQLFGKLTGGRYDRLTLDQDLTLSAGAQGEDTLHSALWRSDGTVDQLYLALRLAVAEELTPNAPVILDDALVRFDDQRMEQALNILKDTSIHRQVILFSCQKREKI